ncbi:Insulinase (Peptidase M16), partial [Rhizopus stolonifer]
YSYNAEVAGLSYYLSQDTKGISLYIGGYSDKLPLLLEKVIDKMKHMRIEPHRFSIFKDEITRAYENFSLEAPFQHSIYYMGSLFHQNIWTYNEHLSEIKHISVQDVQAFIPSILGSLHIEGLVHGSLEKEQAIRMFASIQTMLQPRPLTPNQFLGERATVVPQGHQYVYSLNVTDLEEVNSAISHYSQICSVKNIPLRNRLNLVAQIAQEPCFNQLRTREQLGYMVFSGSKRYLDMLAFRVLIQSERDPVYLENRVLEFLESLRTIIADMNEADYQSQVDSLIAERQEKFQNLYEEGQKYWIEIESGYYEFDDIQKDVKELGLITQASLLEFYDQFIMPSAPQNSTVSVHMLSQKTPLAVEELNVELLYPVLTYLGLIDKTMSEGDFKALIADHAVHTESELRSCLVDVLELSETNIDQVVYKIKQGPSELSKRDHTKLPENYRAIVDPVQFKRSMPLSAAAVSCYPFTTLSCI